MVQRRTLSGSWVVHHHVLKVGNIKIFVFSIEAFSILVLIRNQMWDILEHLKPYIGKAPKDSYLQQVFKMRYFIKRLVTI